jgi:hypothetical protein
VESVAIYLLTKLINNVGFRLNIIFKSNIKHNLITFILAKKSSLMTLYISVCRFQRPRGLRHWLSAARLLRLGFESRRVHGCLSLVSVVCCLAEVSEKGRSLVQESPTECGVSECDHEASKTGKT